MHAIDPALRFCICGITAWVRNNMPFRLTSWMRSQSLGRDVHELHRLGDAGVVDQNVDLAEGCDGLLGGLAAIGEVADVAANSDVTGAKFLGRTLGRSGIQIENGDPGSLLGEKSRCGAAYPARACRP